jgi:hypothetical protein
VVNTAVHILLAVVITLVIAGLIVVARLVFWPRRTRLTHAVAVTSRHVHEHDRPGTAKPVVAIDPARTPALARGHAYVPRALAGAWPYVTAQEAPQEGRGEFVTQGSPR